MFEPAYGDTVVIEILEREGVPFVVRDPRDAHRIQSGDRIIWSTYYARRQQDGAIEPKPYSPDKEPAKSRKPKTGRTETKETK